MRPEEEQKISNEDEKNNDPGVLSMRKLPDGSQVGLESSL